MLTATLLALASAGLHAGWNFLVKTGDDRGLTAWGQFVAGGLVGLPILLVVGFPGWAVLPYLVVSALIHVGYLTALVRSYGHGDFSVAYPLARGSGALLAGIGGVLFLDDDLGVGSWLAIGVVVVGIVLLVGRQPHLPAVLWGLATGLTIGAYTVVDSAGARESDGLAYGLSLILGAAIAVSIVKTARGQLPLFRALLPTAWRRWLVGGICTTAAYTLVLIAVRHAPVGYVATLRESSVLIAALLGWLVLKEPLGERRTAAAAVMTAGLVLLVLSRP